MLGESGFVACLWVVREVMGGEDIGREGGREGWIGWDWMGLDWMGLGFGYGALGRRCGWILQSFLYHIYIL